MTKKVLSRGEKVIAFAERYIKIPEGEMVGQPLKLEPFQRKFILAIYDSPIPVHTAVLSIARKNAKTATIMMILLAHIAGPEAIENSQIASGAMSREQAAVLFALAVKSIQMSPELSARIKIFPSAKKLIGVSKNVEYQAMAAEGKTAHGRSLALAVLDEMGQIRGPTDPFVEAIETSQGAYKNPLKIIISTQAATDADMLSLLIDAPDDPRIVKHIYSAPEDCALDDEDAWRAANPALGLFRSIEDVRKQCEKAKAIPSFEPAFRNLILNQRIEAVSPFVTRSIWELNGEPPTYRPRAKVYGGLDLSSVSDLTAAVLVDADDGSVYPTFWLPAHGLREKSEKDKVPYDVWEKQGFLRTTPGKAIQYRYVAQELRRMFDQFDVQLFGFDRYLMAFLLEWLKKVDENTGKPLFSDEELSRFVEFGQGTASMTPALRDLEVKLLEGQLRHGNQPVLNSCAANAKVVGDSGARKFDKRTARGRIDGMVALAIAVGVMPQALTQESGTLDDYLNDPVML
jgi:phage terminase large subunit-like protein